MGITVFRPGQHIITPSPGVRVWTPGVASAAATWWDNNGAISGCVAAYQPKGAASLAASYINLANPGTYNAAPGVAPTFNAADGWTFNGSTQYLTTSLIPAQAWSIIIRFSNAASADFPIIGQNGGNNNRKFIIPNHSSSGVIYGLSIAVPAGSGLTSGVLAVANLSGYRNGSLESTTGTAWGGATTYPIYIGGANGSAVVLMAGKIQAIAIYNVTLTAGQVATITTAMNAL